MATLVAFGSELQQVCGVVVQMFASKVGGNENGSAGGIIARKYMAYTSPAIYPMQAVNWGLSARASRTYVQLV